ncbi:MAG: trypsin-like peptidase domain-containing protein [Acidobacteriota bacterium]|nr:trypsin-like peptidase domain-containing protein [Acidobacteriota bacterium]
MNSLFHSANSLKRRGLPSLTLLAGVLAGIVLYHQFGALLNAPQGEPREITQRGELRGKEKTTVELFEQTAPSVVFITAKKRGYSFFREVQEVPRGTGSGFVWDKKGHIVTNQHVVEGGNAFEVVLMDQTSYDAKIVGWFRDKDLAVLKIDASPDKLQPIPVGATKDLKVGQDVLAIGNPFGLDHTLTTGVVSALNRTLESTNNRKISGAIQTDAAINPGNSGGPLLDSAGRLIGVNTQIYSPSGASAGIGFAIPVDTVNEVVPQLIKYGKVSRPGLGVNIDPYSDYYARRLRFNGVLIRYVEPGGAAARAGLRGIKYYPDGSVAQIGDIITALDGKPVNRGRDLTYALSGYRIGDVIDVTYMRDNRSYKTEVTLQPIEAR